MQTSSFYLFLLLSSLILALPATLASAQEEPTLALTIEDLQRLGLQANGLVRAAQSQVDIAKANVVGAAAFPNPEVTVMAGPDRPRLPISETGPASNQREITVSQPIENPFLRAARIDSAQAGVGASQASLHQVRADLAAQLRVSAYELLLRQELALMETSIHDLMQEISRRIKVSVDIGEAARFELIRADTEVLSAASRKEAALLNAERARIALVRLTAGTLQPNFKINASLNDPVAFPPLAVLRQEVPAVNPDIVRLEAEQDRAQLRIDEERATVLPSVSILYRNFQDAQFASNTAGINVKIPLFYRRQGEIDGAIFDSARIRETLEYRRFEIGQQLESAWQAKQIAQRRVEMFEGGIVTEAELALRIAQTAYRLGERGFIEVLDTQRVLRGVLAELLQARFELQSAATEIDRLRAHYPKEQAHE
ncbi:outer membrane protein, cobalt-zinc-cadmium efflux system [Nitrosomonas cryotolerans]|uniref:Outer membrane protein, cobalt-zinc-cadmium efflux system n=1 Tax=Nitrosomonas cryotolerans ATCC 49181 TaxID=1131553 RepID=A0A1N6HC95_9PROT|nr:TolC family protein [Nitrosomonas cryotolerans]SFP73755.1 outer membrane protein, cobalt-zinc-cadmium efflux system [Nitrosomonas cryotolerans]SIO17461.1 outer membrane protein, cobalt-zinc-cadmium efflux system [Nitrosomonas cryotolerans ATCC 49181]